MERAPKSDSVSAATPELPGLMATIPSSRRGDVGPYMSLASVMGPGCFHEVGTTLGHE